MKKTKYWQDVEYAYLIDPASRSKLDVALLYPGIWALFHYRVAHRLWQKKCFFIARLISTISRVITGIEIHPAAKISCPVFIDHGMGVVIGATSVIGKRVRLYHGVTLGGTSNNRKIKRHPTIGNDVVIGANATILGDILVGEGARIGASALVIKNVEAKSVIYGSVSSNKKQSYEKINQ